MNVDTNSKLTILLAIKVLIPLTQKYILLMFQNG